MRWNFVNENNLFFFTLSLFVLFCFVLATYLKEQWCILDRLLPCQTLTDVTTRWDFGEHSISSSSSFLIFKQLNLLGWHWLNKITSSIEVCNKPSVCYTVCSPPRGQCPFVTTCLTPSALFNLRATPFPSGTHHAVVCVCEFVCLCFMFYVPHVSAVLWFLSFPTSLISLSTTLSRSIHVVTSDSIF